MDTQTLVRGAFTLSPDRPVILMLTAITHTHTWEFDLPMLNLSCIHMPGEWEYLLWHGAGLLVFTHVWPKQAATTAKRLQ